MTTIIRQATPEDVQGVLADVLGPRRVEVIDKRKNQGFLALADELDALRAAGLKNLVSGQDFMEIYWTTIPLPHGNGVEEMERELAQFAGLMRAQRLSAIFAALAAESPDHVAVIGTSCDPAAIQIDDLDRMCHETQHSAQGSPPEMAPPSPAQTPVLEYQGALPFMIAYLCRNTSRAMDEGHAVGCANELRIAQGQPLAAPADNAEAFRCYNLGNDDVALIASMLTSINATLREGVSVYAVARDYKNAMLSRGLIG